jgi:uncharacterized protein YgiM (DUF1202 family)
MAGAQERPFDAGRFPMKKEQWEAMAEVAAELCKFYLIPVTPKTVLGHGEVQKNLGITQRGKWDPMVLPWDPRARNVGDLFRDLVSERLERLLPSGANVTGTRPLKGRVVVPRNDVLNLRTAAGASSALLAELAPNTEVKILSDPTASWMNVEANRKVGWVNSRFIEIIAS